MDTRLFGNGTLRLDWTGASGRPGLSPQLVLKARLISKGYAVGTVVQISSEVTAWDIAGTYAFLGTTPPKNYVLNWTMQQYDLPNSPPKDEIAQDVELWLSMPPSIIEGLEERRQGKDFSLRLDTTVLLVDEGDAVAKQQQVYDATRPLTRAQDPLRISQADWSAVLEGWERGVGFTILVPIAATEPNVDRAEVVRHIRSARQKIDGGDYTGSFTESRLALELLRKLTPAALPLPRNSRDRTPPQRIRAVLEALYDIGSMTQHTDPAIKEFSPVRADAVGLAAGTASIAQQVYALLDREP